MENNTEQVVVDQAAMVANGLTSDLPMMPGPQDPSMMMQTMPDGSMMPPMPMPEPISADEIALYDRQIRLWGVKAQELIRNANILLVGIKALGNEIAKNLVLAGIGGLTILDHENVTEEDLGSQFLINEGDVGKNRAEAAAVELRKMNPRVNITVDQDSVLNKMADYFALFNIVITTGQPFEMASTINMSCRMFNVKFYATDLHGMYGYIFSDLIMHQFLVEKDIQGNIPTKIGIAETGTRVVMGVETKKENNKIKEIVTKQEMFCPMLLANSSPLPLEATKSRRAKLRVPAVLSCFRGLFEFQKQFQGRLPSASRDDLAAFTKLTNDKHLELGLPHDTLNASVFRSFLQNLGTEIPPTAAFLGGQLAQDVINVLGQREQPLQNFMIFDGDDFKAPIYSLQPLFDPTLAISMNDMPADDLPLEANGVTNGMSNGNELQVNGGSQPHPVPVPEATQEPQNATGDQSQNPPSQSQGEDKS